jgi:asparagine synthase (glutamine-hydrolysing)
MSGIAAVYGKSCCSEMEKMLSKIVHRGPGGKVIYRQDGMMLGKTIFASKPLDAGHNGICECSGKSTHSVVFDGLITNREALVRKVGPCELDDELVLRLYLEYGPDFLNLVEGMYALIIAAPGELLAARDPFGIKPLYFGRKGGAVYLASEVKALMEATDNIKIFQPGHYYTPAEGFKKFFSFNEKPWHENIAPEKAAGEIKARLLKVVDRYLPPGGQACVLLSGGLDSSVLAAVASGSKNLKTFCVGTEGAGDLEASRLMAEYLKTEHYTFTYDREQILAILPQVIYYLESFDPSLVRSSVANYLAFRLASPHTRVMLSGEGGDELFAGYAYMKELGGGKNLHHELAGCLGKLHNIGLQRVDRMSMAHSIECRMPFLDMDLVQYALTLPPEWKIYGEQKIEKWILRKSFEGFLPDSVLWRLKQEFSQGSGTVDVMREIAEDKISDKVFEKEKSAASPPLRTKEEVMYYRIYREFFDSDAAVQTVGRWVTP